MHDWEVFKCKAFKGETLVHYAEPRITKGAVSAARRVMEAIIGTPFPYTEAAEFHPRWSLSSKAMVYFICGGIPLYLNFFKQGNSVEKNIEDNLLNEYSPLFREPDFLLREELRDIQNYYAILMAIAQGFMTNPKIAGRTGIPERSLHYYLQQLIAELDRKVPAYPNPRNATIGRRIFLNKIPPKMDTGSSDLHWHSLQDLYH